VTDLPTVKDIAGLAGLLAPGLLVMSIRARVATGAVPDIKDRLITFAVVSAAYYAAMSPIFHDENGVALRPALWSFLYYFGVPTLVGIAAAYVNQFEIAYRAAERLGLRLAHHIPAAWDYRFERLKRGTYILVTLKSGHFVAGLMGKNSFASSSREERDIYLEEVWDIASDGPWSKVTPRRGVLICGSDIRYIEFFSEAD